jgi:glycosyltransferase involved in cell wall biosynthesis
MSKKIVMISMFKNEAKNIRHMLNSITPYIDYWILQDNGSTDGTPDIVNQWHEETKIPGFIYNVEEGWVGFGWNRDHLLQKCKATDHGCDWIMKMDCDENLEIDSDFDWSPFDNTNIQSFHVPSKLGAMIYMRAWIWNAKLNWRFNHDPAHETIYLDDGVTGENFDRVNLSNKFKMIGGQRQGESYTVATKYVTDALNLEEKLIRENSMLTDMYHFWYIGKSYEDCYRGSFFPLKGVHQNEYARRCIFYFQEYIKVKNGTEDEVKFIDEMIYYSMCGIGNAYRFLKEYDKAIEYYKKAEKFCPPRNDHFVFLAEAYFELNDFHTMRQYTSILMDTKREMPFPNYIFLINADFYHDGNYAKHLHKLAIENYSVLTHEFLFSVNVESPKKRLFIVDNFYTIPDQVRKFALEQEFEGSSDWYKGSRTFKQFLYPQVKSAFEKIMGRKIKEWESHGMNGKFQFCTPKDLLVYHNDSQTWAAMIYLTPNAPFSTGTSFYAHKETKIRHIDEPGGVESSNCFSGGYFDSTKFELVDTVGNIYNRLVIFDARMFHAAAGYFGQTKEDSRLFQIFFFD